MSSENTIESLTAWSSRRAELQEAKEAASREVSEASEPARTALFQVNRIQAELDFYEPKRAGSHRSGGSKADHDRLRDEITSARKTLVETEAVKKQALDRLEAAELALEEHAQTKPAVTKDDIKTASETVAALSEDRARVEQRLLELEDQDENVPVADARAAVEEAKQQVEKIAAANSLGEANDTEVKQATGALAKAEDELKTARMNSASRAQAVAGLKRRLKDTESQLEQAEATRKLAVLEFGTAFHHQGVEKLNKAAAAPAFTQALSEIAIADQLLNHVRSGTRLLGGSPGLQIDTERHAHISGFDIRHITADDTTDAQASALIEELGL